jgi:hypothetical protein
MFTEPKRGDGLNESKVCYATKQLWAITTFHDTYNEITFKHFIEHIGEFIEKYGFDWPKGKKYPEYGTAKDWPQKYDYQECVECYENHKLGNSKKEADLIFDKKYLSDTITDFKRIDRLNKRHETLEEIEDQTGEDQTYRKAKIEEEINSIWNRICVRLGKDKETEQSDEIIKIPNNPEHEDQHIRDIWTERAKQDVMPR